MPFQLAPFFYALNGRAPGPASSTHLDFDITNSCPASLRSTEDDLISAIESAVIKCIAREPKNLFLSLSAGYDSTAILAAFVSKRQRVKTFSYGLTTPPQWSDVEIARQTARRLECQHKIWPMNSYPVDILQQENARLFGFRANRCGELGAWLHYRDEIAPTLTGRSLFVFGDECFGWNDSNIRHNNDLLHSIAVVTQTELIEPFLDHDINSIFREAYSNELSRIVKRAAHLDEWHDKKDFLYFHERVQKVILPWREQFAGNFGDFADPLLDKDILTIVGSLNSYERRGKRLMKRAVRRAFPKAFQFRRAARSGAPELPVLSPWPDRYTKEEITHACQTIGLNSRFLTVIQARITANQQQNHKPSNTQEYKVMLKNLLKDTLLARMVNATLPPNASIPPLDLMLSRLQIWVLSILDLENSSCAKH